MSPVDAAPPVRLAVVASSDVGAGDDAPLRYADQDAQRVAAVLTELGGFDPGDVWLVPDADVETVTHALSEVVLRSAAVHAGGGSVELWVYYTGHAAADGLHLHGEVLPLTAWKTAARVVPAAQRVFVVDACQSGQFLRSKGAALVSVDDAPRDFTPPADEAWIASAGAEESAFEVDGRRGALFTHFFVSGARGAADGDADGVVTLGELYGFVHARTSAEAAGLGYVQQPRWAGALGDVVVSRTAAPSGIDARGPFARPLLLVDERRGQVVAEVPAGAGARMAVPPGPYQLVALDGGARVEVGRVVVPEAGWATASPDALRPARGVRTRGGLVDVRSGGISGGVLVASARAPGARGAPGVWLEGRRAVGRGFDASIGGFAARSAVTTDAFRGTAESGGLQVGVRLDVLPGPVRLGPSADVTGGVVHQDVARTPDPVWGAWFGDDPARSRATAAWVAPHGGLGLDLPAGPIAWTASVGIGPSLLASEPVRVGVDAVARVGLEWGRR